MATAKSSPPCDPTKHANTRKSIDAVDPACKPKLHTIKRTSTETDDQTARVHRYSRIQLKTCVTCSNQIMRVWQVLFKSNFSSSLYRYSCMQTYLCNVQSQHYVCQCRKASISSSITFLLPVPEIQYFIVTHVFVRSLNTAGKSKSSANIETASSSIEMTHANKSVNTATPEPMHDQTPHVRTIQDEQCVTCLKYTCCQYIWRKFI